MPKLNIDKNNVIGLAQEPNCFLNINNNFIRYFVENIKKYYIGNLNYKGINLKYPFIEKFSYYLPHFNYKNIKINHKTKLMNYVYSRKNNNINTLYKL
jgi:DNA polymerase sigma